MITGGHFFVADSALRIVGVAVLRLERENVDLVVEQQLDRVGVEVVDVAVEEEEHGAVRQVLDEVGADQVPLVGAEVPAARAGERRQTGA